MSLLCTGNVSPGSGVADVALFARKLALIASVLRVSEAGGYVTLNEWLDKLVQNDSAQHTAYGTQKHFLQCVKFYAAQFLFPTALVC